MSFRVKTCSSLFGFILCAAALSGICQAQSVPAGGIVQASDDAAAQALDLFNQGKLPDAEEAYTALLAKYPTAGVAPEAMYRLGSIQYLRGEYPQALATLKRIVSPPASEQIKTAADLLAPQILAGQAGKMNPADPKRNAAYADALKAFDNFVQTYPNSPDVQSALFGKATAQFQMQDFPGAEKTLVANLQHFPNSDSIVESEDLLAQVLTAEGSSMLQSHGDQQAAFAKLKGALPYLANIITRRTDVSLANEAQFQIGEVLYDRGSAETGSGRTKVLSNAILAYRAVRPNDALIQEQQQRVNAVTARARATAATGNQAALADMQQIQDGETAKLEALKHAPDQTLYAQLRIAECYFLMQKYDEARVLLDYLQPFADDPGQKKQIQYYLVMTYASQGIMDKAEQGYNAFMSAYRGDPIGENLPVLMGAAFLSASNNNPQKAAYYLQQERDLYPHSSLVNDALNEEASALVGLHKYDEAIDAYQKFLQTSPPPDQAEAAEAGIGAIYQQTGKLQQAIDQDKKVADKYPGTPLAEQCAFYAAGLETTVDIRQALPQLQAFAAKYPEGKFTPQAMMMAGQAQAAAGNTAAAMQTYKDLASRFPHSELAPQAYFQQAAILASQQKIDEMVALLKSYITTYPNDKNIFYAYDTIGQAQVSKGNVTDAIATYTEMADQHGDDPMAPTALARVADLWRKQADALGHYLALNETQRAAWSKSIAGSLAAGEELLQKFPDSAQAGVALQTLLSDQEMLLDAKQRTSEDVAKYFQGLAAKFAADPSAKSRILFTLATYTYQTNPAQGIAQMDAAYNPSLVYAPADLDLYGAALINEGKSDQAYKLYQKIVTDYPIPPNAQPSQAPVATQEAQATALYGMGDALETEGKIADAAKLFEQLKANYPWSPKVIDANFGIAKAEVQQNQLDDATKLLVPIVGSRVGSASIRAHALVLIGDIQAARNNVDAAIDSYLKAAAFYGGVPDAASEALWKGGQMLEKQAATLSEQSAPKRSEQLQKAVNAYKEIQSQYPNSQFLKQAQGRISALGQ
jgi:TolA-binding protein